MLMLITAYIVMFATLGFYLFRGTQEGSSYFGDISDAIFNLLVLLTTANFPDIMLPAYNINPLYCLFFIVYLILGLFFLMNLLLAVFYNNYKNRLEEGILMKDDDRMQFLSN